MNPVTWPARGHFDFEYTYFQMMEGSGSPFFLLFASHWSDQDQWDENASYLGFLNLELLWLGQRHGLDNPTGQTLLQSPCYQLNRTNRPHIGYLGCPHRCCQDKHTTPRQKIHSQNETYKIVTWITLQQGGCQLKKFCLIKCFFKILPNNQLI